MEDELVALYEAQAPIVAILTGGIYSSKALGNKGLVPGNPLAAAAFEEINGFQLLKPCLVVREVIDTPTSVRADQPTRARSVDTAVSNWFYQYEFSDQIDAASALIDDLVTHHVFPNIGYLMPVLKRHGLIAPEFQDVSLRIDDYRVKRVKRT